MVYTRRSLAYARAVKVDTITISEDAADLDGDELADIYGTKFVDQIIYGAQLDVVFTVTSTQEIDLQEIEAELKGRIGVGELSLDFEAKFERQEGEERAELEMSIVAFGSGVNFSVKSNPSFKEVNDIIDNFNAEYEELIDELRERENIDEEENVLRQLSPIGFTLGSIADHERKLSRSTVAVLDRRMGELQETLYDTLFWISKLEKSLEAAYAKYAMTPRSRLQNYVPFEREVLGYIRALDGKLNECLAYRRLPLELLVGDSAEDVPEAFQDDALYGLVGEGFIPSPLTIEGEAFEGIYYEGYTLPRDGAYVPWLSGTAKRESDNMRVAVADVPQELAERITHALTDKARDGEFCEESSDCDSNLCIDSICLRGDGDLCEQDEHCQSGRCDGEPGELTCFPRLKDGELCDETSDCESNLCVDGICLRGLFDVCVEDEDCESGRCDGAPEDRKCHLRLKAGVTCNEPTDCESGRCDAICLGRINDTCGEDRHCQSGRCDGPPENRQCLDRVGAGETCNEHTDCESGRCQGEYCVILTKRGWSGYQNSFDKNMRAEFEQSNGQRSAICGMNSYHDSHHEDRRTRFKWCDPVTPTSTPTVWTSSWSAYDEASKVDCPRDSFLSVIESQHDSHREDRRFRYTCSRFQGYSYASNTCQWTPNYQNQFDGGLSFECPDQYVMTGIESHHDSRHEDRRFKFKCCKMQN